MIARRDTVYSPVDFVRGANLNVWAFDHLIASQDAFNPVHYWLDIAPFMDLSQGYDAYREQRRNAGTSLISQAER